MFSIIYAKIYDETYPLDKNLNRTVKVSDFYGTVQYI